MSEPLIASIDWPGSDPQRREERLALAREHARGYHLRDTQDGCPACRRRVRWLDRYR